MATVEIKGLQKIVGQLQRLGHNVNTIADNSLQQSAYAVKREVENNIQTVTATHNGHLYKAVDTGQLLRSIHIEKLGLCRYAVGTAVEHAPYVEFGTGSAGDPAVAHTMRPKWVYFDTRIGEYRTAYPQPPRPFMRPAFISMKSVVTMNLTRAIIAAAMSEVTP